MARTVQVLKQPFWRHLKAQDVHQVLLTLAGLSSNAGRHVATCAISIQLTVPGQLFAMSWSV